MKFLLVAPRYVAENGSYVFPLGLAYISSFLKSRGFEVSCLNLCQESGNSREVVRQRVLDEKIDCVCTGGMSVHYTIIEDVVKGAQAARPDIVTVVGGPIVTAHPELTISSLDITYGVIGEGEYTMAELAEAIEGRREIDTVKGIIYLDDGQPKRTQERKGIEDLDALPYPDYDGFGFRDWLKIDRRYQFGDPLFTLLDSPLVGTIITSRSCPFSCTFCYHPLGRVYRQRSLDNVFGEIDHLKKTYGINGLNVLDELFSAKKARMYEFAERMKAFDVIWSASLRVPDVDEEVLKSLREGGLVGIAYGIESFSDTILTSMRKKATRAQNIRALELTRKAGICTMGGILFGDPAETEETIEETLSWWRENNHKYNLGLAMIRPIPDAPLYHLAVEKGLVGDKLDFMKKEFPIVNLTNLPDTKFNEIYAFVNSNWFRPDMAPRATVTYSRLNGLRSDRGRYFDFGCTCPECGEESHYKNFVNAYYKSEFFVLCRSCRATFTVDTRAAFVDDFRTGKLANIILKNVYYYASRSKFITELYRKSKNKQGLFAKIIRLRMVIERHLA